MARLGEAGGSPFAAAQPQRRRKPPRRRCEARRSCSLEKAPLPLFSTPIIGVSNLDLAAEAQLDPISGRGWRAGGCSALRRRSLAYRPTNRNPAKKPSPPRTETNTRT